MESFKVRSTMDGLGITGIRLDGEEASRFEYVGNCPLCVTLVAPVLHRHPDSEKVATRERVVLHVDRFARHSPSLTKALWGNALDNLANLDLYPLQVDE